MNCLWRMTRGLAFAAALISAGGGLMKVNALNRSRTEPAVYAPSSALVGADPCRRPCAQRDLFWNSQIFHLHG